MTVLAHDDPGVMHSDDGNGNALCIGSDDASVNATAEPTEVTCAWCLTLIERA